MHDGKRGGIFLKKHVRAFTAEFKIDAVLSGDCTQTIRPNWKTKVGDRILFHNWSGKPYHSEWGWRFNVTVQEVAWIRMDTLEGIQFVNLNGTMMKEHIQDEWHGWNSQYVNSIAKRDGFSNGIEMREWFGDDIFSLDEEARMNSKYEIIRWNAKDAPG